MSVESLMTAILGRISCAGNSAVVGATAPKRRSLKVRVRRRDTEEIWRSGRGV